MKKLNHLFFTKGLAIAGLCINLVGCSDAFDTSYFDKEINDTTIGVGLKIGHSTYSAKELFEEISEDLEVQPSSDGDNLVSFIYRDEIKGESNDNITKVNNQTIESENHELELPEIDSDNTYNGDSRSLSKTLPSKLTLKNNEDAELSFIEFLNGKLQVTDLKNTIGGKVDINLIFNSLIKNGVPYQTGNFTIGSSIPPAIELEGYSLNLKDGDNLNTINVTVETSFNIEKGNKLNPDGRINYKVIFLNSKTKAAEGDFKQPEFKVNNQNFDIDFFENIGDGIIKVQNPVLKLIAKNQYGFPVGFGVEGISAVTEDGTIENIIIDKENILPEHNIVKSTDSELTGYYGVVKAATTQETITEIILNGENSNLEDLFNNKPSLFNLAVTALSNPNSPDNNTNTFDIDNRLDMDVEVELPLHVSFENLTFEPEPFEIDTEDIEEIEEDVTSLDLIIFSRNTIPLSGTVSLDFVDTNGNLKFSIPSNSKNIEAIEAAPVDNNQESIRSLEVVNGKTVLKEGANIIEAKKTIITLSQEQIKLLKEVTHIEAFLKFDSAKDKDAVKVKITDQVRFDIAITSDITVSLSGDEDEENTNN